MFKYSLCFATLAGLIFLLRGDDDGKQEKKRKVSRELTQDFDYDDYDEYEDFDYSDIDIDDLDYDTLKELEMTLSNMGLGQQDSQKESSKAKTDKKPKLEQDITKLRANLGGLEEFKQEALTEEDIGRGYKVANLKMLTNFEAPDNIESEELLKKWREEL